MMQRVFGPGMLPYAAGIVVVLMLFRVLVMRLVNAGIDAAAGQPFEWYDVALVALAAALTVAALFRYRTRLDPGS